MDSFRFSNNELADLLQFVLQLVLLLLLMLLLMNEVAFHSFLILLIHKVVID